MCLFSVPISGAEDSNYVTGQSPLIRRLSIEQGLPSSEITNLAQDAAGYLWLGTDAGLVRFDGKQFQRWEADGAQLGAVEHILVDASDRLWYGVAESGLILLDKDRRFQRHFSVEGTPGWPSNDVWAMAESADGSILVGMYQAGLLKLRADGSKFERVSVQGDQSSLSVLALEQDVVTGDIWVGTHESGVLRIKSGGSVATPVAEFEPIGGRIDAILSTPQGAWLTVHDYGVCLLDGPSKLACALFADEGPALGNASALALGLDGSLWVGRARGLSRRRPDGKWQHFPASRGSHTGLPSRRVSDLHVAADGAIWMSSRGAGLVHVSALSIAVEAWVSDIGSEYSLPDARIATAVSDSNGVWIGTRSRGLFRYDSTSKLVTEVSGDLLPTVYLWAIASAEGPALWVAHMKGLSLLDVKRGQAVHWHLSRLGPGFTDLLKPISSDTVLASTYGSGLSLVHRSKPQVKHVLADLHEPLQIEDIQAGHEEIWIASEQGLHQYDPGCECLLYIPLSNERTFALAADPSGWWVATSGAMNHLAQTATGWAVDRSIPWAGRPPGGMAVDGEGRLWASGPEGLYLLEKGGAHWRDLAPGLGPIGRELSSRPFSVDDGVLLLPSDTGLLRIDPEKLPPAPRARSLRLTRAGVRRGGVWTELDVQQAATLLPADRDFGITLESPLIGEASSLRFETRVVGLDALWVESDQGARNFGTIPSGEYQLEARVWHPASREHFIEVDWPFRVLPPWWLRWPAIASFLIGLAGLLYLGHRLTVRTALRRHRQRMEVEQLVWAEQNAADKSAFLAHLSHEIRNPLSGLMGLLQLAERDAEPTQRTRLGLIRAAGGQIQALLNDVLAWSKVQQGDLPLRLQTIAITDVADEVVQRWQSLALDRQVELVMEGDPSTCVVADRLRLAQLLDNLLSNALKFGEGGQVLLSWESVALQGVEIAVSDEGIGVPAEAAERIFGAREQCEKDGRGLGLGLSIGRQLAILMGGSLTLDRRGWEATGKLSSNAQVGSRFVLGLPRGEDHVDSVDDQSKLEAIQPTAKRENVHLGRVVYVEDDSMQRSRWAEEFAGFGFEVSAHAEALAALSVLSQQPTAALITDLGLPVVNGLELIALVRQLPGLDQLPILVITARAMPADRSAAIEAGADEVMVKPVDSLAVSRWLAEHCG